MMPKVLDRTFTSIGQPIVPDPHKIAPAFVGSEPESDEVRVNQATLEFIRSNELYNREGLAAKFAAAAAAKDQGLIQFPAKAKEVKARWVRITEARKGRYHWKMVGNEVYGLAAFHVITKDTPMWFWCDFLHEDFADQEPADSFRDTTTLGANAAHGRDGVRDETRNSKWEHYRLKGTQLTFTDARGNNTVLGNELIESGRAAVSSCITCHASAGVDAQGRLQGAGFVLGVPPPSNFVVGGRLVRLQTDFLYSVPLRAQSKSPPAGPAASAGARAAAAPIVPRVLEGYPLSVSLRLKSLQAEIAAGLQSPLQPAFIRTITQEWKPGQTVTVAFRGGDAQLHRQIADATKAWTSHANLVLDFGWDAATQRFRRWSTADQAFAADIRISFDRRGYYSLVGTDSINNALTSPAEPSMNLEGFDRVLPEDWRAVVLHEFGHALGFQHEHQHPVSPCDFRWDDDPGYDRNAARDRLGQFIPDAQGRRPGIYTLLGGPPNRWSPEVVDFNLRALPDSRAFRVGPFDKLSIMKYYFEPYMFVNGDKSHCYAGGENLELSAEDIVGIAAAYPRTAAAVQPLLDERSMALKALEATPTLSAPAKAHYERLRDQ